MIPVPLLITVKLSKLMHEAIHFMNENGRKEDFIHTLHAIREGFILQNVAFHLMLNFGLFHALASVLNMRYSDKQRIIPQLCKIFFLYHLTKSSREKQLCIKLIPQSQACCRFL